MQDPKPDGALGWFSTLSSALSSVTDSSQTVIAWDKFQPSSDLQKKKGAKTFAVFANHEILWRELQKLDRDARYAYELIQPKKLCKAYWDIEFSKKVDVADRDTAKDNVILLLRQWIVCLKSEFRAAFKSAKEDARVAVLDGSRDLDTENVKYSFHVIIVNYAFSSNKSTAFHRLREKIPPLSEVICNGVDPRFIPSASDKCAPDLCVWKDNQLFRILSCSKRGSSTPLCFCDKLTETGNPMETFVTFLNPDIQDLSTEDTVQVPPAKKKRKTGHHNHHQATTHQPAADDHGSKVQHMMAQYPDKMEEIHKQVQLLLQSWGDNNTYVEKLVRASRNLRYQCRNVFNRPCLFTTENHQSNTPIVWLDAPRSVNEGDLSDTYHVTYICKSSECNCHGIIGEIYTNSMDLSYTFKQVCPAIMKSSPVQSQIKHIQVTTAPENSVFDEILSSHGEEEEETLTHKKNLIQDRLHGWGWTDEEKRVYGIENSYKFVKEEFERSMCKVESPNVVYIRFNDPENNLMDYDHYTYDGMQHLVKSIFYYKKDSQYDPPVPVRFFSSWTDDSTSRSYNKIVFDPSESPTDFSSTCSGNLNLWPGIKASKILTCSDSNFSVDDLVGPIRNHILDVLTGGNLDHCEWILDWMANIVKRPHMKTQVPIVISGKQGVGKGIIFDFFREHVLGSSITSQIQNPAQDLFSRFANSHVNKIFLQIDEGEGLSKFSDHLKNLITADRMHYEIKGLSPTSTNNYINIVITTNHERPVLVETSDRRYVLFKASDVHLSDPDYYLNLASHMKRPEVARAFYDFLYARDIESKYPEHFQASRPMTDYYKESRKNSIPIMQRFLSAVANSGRYTSEVSSLALFKDFVQFTEAGRFQTHMTSCKFGSLLNNINGISKLRRPKGVHYSIDCEILKSYLLQNHEYDDDAALDT